MKITIISPKFPFDGRIPIVPPILEYLAALTLREDPTIKIELIDANQNYIDPVNLDTDLVALSVMTAKALWAYQYADTCRQNGIPVVMGGIHPTALPEEASLHANAVVIGEAESVWRDVLSDAKNGRLKKFYRGERQSLEGLPMIIDGGLKGNYRFRAFFTMRGCPHRCTFCSVRRFYGDTIRYRPIPEVTAEIEARAGKVWFNGDDNIWGGDIQRSIALFEELSKGSKKSWYGFGDLRSVQGKEGEKMLTTARKSGLFSVWVGWESDSDTCLNGYKASNKQGADRITAIKRMRSLGIDVVLFVLLGGRQDSIDSFQRTLELADRMQISVHPTLLTPLPATELFENYRDYLIKDLGWESYTGASAVFSHPDPLMTPEKRDEEYQKLCRQLYTYKRIAKRIINIPATGFPTTHLMSLMKQFHMKRALQKAYEEWQEKK